MSTIDRVTKITKKLRTNNQAARLWNWIDLQPEPEVLWAIMLKFSPDYFFDPNDANSLKF